MEMFLVCGVNEAKVKVARNTQRINPISEHIPFPGDFAGRSIVFLKIDPIGNFTVEWPDVR